MGIFVLSRPRSFQRFESTDKRKASLIYGLQTKILEDGTKDEMRIFEVLFNGS